MSCVGNLTEINVPLKLVWWVRSSVVVKALCYTAEGRRFGTRCGKRIFSVYLILPAALGPGVYSASDRNEYQKQKNDVSGE
jgi:hypothetical protein